jgi:hypothetical protein
VVAVKLVPVEKVPEGGFFQKRTGTYTYIRIAYASAGRFINQSHGYTFGVTYNGNMTRLDNGTLVRLCTIDDFAKNVRDDLGWYESVGCTDLEPTFTNLFSED